jgi:hypothetical protein
MPPASQWKKTSTCAGLKGLKAVPACPQNEISNHLHAASNLNENLKCAICMDLCERPVTVRSQPLLLGI